MNPVPDKSIEGIAPLEFFGPHPVWEGFTIPVRRKGRVNHFYCTFCKIVFPGDSTRAYGHMVKRLANTCKIPREPKEFLVRKEKAFSERRLQIASKKNQVNGGASTREHMDAGNLMGKLMVELSGHQDSEIRDGTSWVVVMVGALLEHAEQLLEIGFHPIRIAEGFEVASNMAFNHLECISKKFELSADNMEALVQSCLTTVSSGIH